MFAAAESWADRILKRILEHETTRNNDKPFKFVTSCVGSTEESITAMTRSFTKREVTYKTMARHCHLEAFKEALQYATPHHRERGGLLLQDDPFVLFWRSRYEGKPCYYLEHSRIEYIWIKP